MCGGGPVAATPVKPQEKKQIVKVAANTNTTSQAKKKSIGTGISGGSTLLTGNFGVPDSALNTSKTILGG